MNLPIISSQQVTTIANTVKKAVSKPQVSTAISTVFSASAPIVSATASKIVSSPRTVCSATKLVKGIKKRIANVVAKLFPSLLSKNTVGTNGVAPITRFGKHKVPRYLYHFTNPEALEGMKKTGSIRISEDAYSKGKLSGVFMVDMENFAKRWKRHKAWDDGNLKIALWNEVQGKGKVTCIRIPTEKLDQSILKIRSQNRYFMAKKQGKKEYLEHAVNGDKAQFRSLYDQRKEALEYIYPKEIPMDAVQVMETVQIGPIYNNCRIGTDPSEIILKVLCHGKPERVGLDKILK